MTSVQYPIVKHSYNSIWKQSPIYNIKDLNKHFSIKDIKMANKHMRRCTYCKYTNNENKKIPKENKRPENERPQEREENGALSCCWEVVRGPQSSHRKRNKNSLWCKLRWNTCMFGSSYAPAMRVLKTPCEQCRPGEELSLRCRPKACVPYISHGPASPPAVRSAALALLYMNAPKNQKPEFTGKPLHSNPRRGH